MTLMEKTITLLTERGDQSLPEIAVSAGVNYYWLRKFLHGEIEDPSVNKVEALYNYLTGAPLIPNDSQ